MYLYNKSYKGRIGSLIYHIWPPYLSKLSLPPPVPLLSHPSIPMLFGHRNSCPYSVFQLLFSLLWQNTWCKQDKEGFSSGHTTHRSKAQANKAEKALLKEFGEAGHIASRVKKQMLVFRSLAFSFFFGLAPQTTEWWHSHSFWPNLKTPSQTFQACLLSDARPCQNDNLYYPFKRTRTGHNGLQFFNAFWNQRS